MVIGELLKEGVLYLQERGISQPRLDCEVLLSHVLEKDRLFLAVHREQEVLEEQAETFRNLYHRRGFNEPVAYLVGHREFMSLDFSVSPGILIPRPDTETLVEFVIERFKEISEAEILDLCTGSGAVAVSLAHYLPRSRVTAVDISPICVKTAKDNARRNGVADRVTVLEKNVLELTSDKRYDCVVSNPPYIPSEAVTTLEPDVKDFEPGLALDGGEDGLVFYRYLAQNSASWLKDGGILALEVGHDQGQIVAALLEETKAFRHIGFCQDLAGICRVVYGQKK